MKFLILLFFLFSVFLRADEYELGHGLKLDDKLNIGGYFSLDYEVGNQKRQFRLDDVAIMAYGDLTPKLSYMLELEATSFYVKNYTTDTSTRNTSFHYERMYLNYTFSETFNLRIGKQITPIGYWNLEPINVLRDTSSNPLYSNQIFPKFLTGIDIYGYLNEDDTLKYHLFTQKNNDLDEDYINIKNNRFFGVSLEYEASSEVSFGGSIGEYKTKIVEKQVNFVQVDAKYDNYLFLLQAEMVYSSIDNRVTDDNSYKTAGYVQGVYNFNMKHAIIGRYEYFDDNEADTIKHIGVFGYSYRPMQSISLKAEYQWNADSDLSKSLISFSVLF